MIVLIGSAETMQEEQLRFDKNDARKMFILRRVKLFGVLILAGEEKGSGGRRSLRGESSCAGETRNLAK